LEVVRQLLEAGAKTGILNKRGLTALGEALVANRVDAARAIVGAGGDLGARCAGFTEKAKLKETKKLLRTFWAQLPGACVPAWGRALA
jgi:ankyrin repeat protein